MSNGNTLVDERINTPAEKPLYQYLVIRSMTLYYARRAQTKISISGPFDRFTDSDLSNLSLAQVFNVVAADGWRLVSAAGKGGDHEKFVFERLFRDSQR